MPAPDYLEHGLKIDRADLEHVRTLINQTAETLQSVFIEDRWPYVVRDGKAVKPPDKISASTNSMIAFALAGASGVSIESSLAPRPPANVLDEGLTEELKALLVSAADAPVKQAAGRDLESETYGANDPFTLGWLVPLVDALEIQWTSRDRIVQERLDEAWGRDRRLFKPNNGIALDHAFSLLRVVHLSQSVGRTLDADLAETFQVTVHRQLSNSEIGDASFDPAELIFAFEGLLLSPGGEPSSALVDRFFDVIAEAQQRSSSWRPLRPFIRTETGLVLLPLSIEGATSLLRICRELDKRDGRHRRFSQLIEQFRTYFEWLESQRVQITVDGQELRGWHSEHVREAQTIYTWQTSQVLVFLLLYLEQLRTHIAEQALAAANLSVNHHPEAAPPTDSVSWKLVRETFLDAKGQTKKRSAVLYGPPGTGKTTLAEWLAHKLGWPMITVTPSDFMAQGTAAVEARAQAVFKALQQQRGAVVIFDEIDRLVLDRDREEYHRSEGAFQMMTPSMLTKLNDLRKAGDVIFLAATNYGERMDGAIVRSGRFDKQLLILPPNLEDRITFIRARWTKNSALGVPDEHRLAAIAKTSKLVTYSELKDLVQDAKSVEELEHAVGKFKPAITIEGYKRRMDDDIRPPVEELTKLEQLVAEAQ